MQYYSFVYDTDFFCDMRIILSIKNKYYRIDISDSYIQKMKFRREYTPPQNYNDDSRAYGAYFGQGKTL